MSYRPPAMYSNNPKGEYYNYDDNNYANQNYDDQYDNENYDGNDYEMDMGPQGFGGGPGPGFVGGPGPGFVSGRGPGNAPRPGFGRGFGSPRGGYRNYGPRSNPNFNNEPFPPDHSYMWGRGFGPTGPPLLGTRRPRPRHNKIKFLIRCGVSKEHLHNIPNALLKLLGAQYCGLCTVGFDSYEIARVHYVSKNHLKKHIKWISHHTEIGGVTQSDREVPIKSRDLYCELCDVHITSKSHGESHYSGRAHHAIVEGRRNPKNPILLEAGMEDRLEQLIRREKKCASVSKLTKEKKGENKEEAKEVKKEVKSSPPELQCVICKTFVTCSEQMTTHLNGKRHLTKEKRHILKMMKTETEDVKDKKGGKTAEVSAAEGDIKAEEGDTIAAGEETVVGKDENITEVNGDEAEDDDDDAEDWTNGDGNWDDAQ